MVLKQSYPVDIFFAGNESKEYNKNVIKLNKYKWEPYDLDIQLIKSVLKINKH